uniref:FCH and mu domain containing endocytic adaptor 1 n=1 Tax=Lepisosteus oculatus TaxID=7918 RepID=W5LXY9_LEPOC
MAHVCVMFQGDKNAGFDVLYHNMKHGQIATKELAEFVRERAAIEETYSKSMNKLAKMASNSSQLGTFAPMWDVFRVSCDKLALCHLELMRKMNDLIRDINKYGEEQVKIHRKTKEEVTGTLEAVQNLQASSSHLQKSKENYHSKCLELERLRREGAPQKELEKAESKSKKAAESFSTCVEKYNRVGGDFQQKMSESAQKFQSIEEAHLRQMKLLIKSYSHSIEDTHVQVGQVHEEFKQNVENIGIENLIQKFAEQKGTGKERPDSSVGFEEYSSSTVLEVGKKIRNKAFRIPGLGKREKEPDSTSHAFYLILRNSPEVDAEGFVIRADINQNDIEKETNFYSSDSDFDDDEPKKFHIQIRPVASGGRHSSAAAEQELKATVGALTLPPQRGVSVKRHLTRVRSGGEGDSATQRKYCDIPFCILFSRISSTVPGSETLFGPPLDSAFKPNTFAGTGSLMGLSSSTDAAFSSDSSSPENVEDSGLDSPSHPPLGPSPEPCAWAAWPGASHSKELGLAGDPFLAAFRDPSPGRPPAPPEGTEFEQFYMNGICLCPPGTPPPSRRDISEVLVVAPPRPSRSRRAAGGRLTGSERSRSVCSSPLPGPSPNCCCRLSSLAVCLPTAPCDRPLSLSAGLSRGPSPISLSTQEAWPVAAAITEYINAYFKGGEHNRCLVKITGDLTMSFPAGITRVFTANPNAPVLSFRLVNIARVDHFLPNQKLLYSDPSQSDPETRDFWFNMQALQLHLQREAELNPQASYYNVGLLKYQVSSQDPGCAPLLLSAECQRSGTVTRVSLDYHCCPATAPASQLSGVQVVLPLEETASDVQCQPPGVWNADEHRLLWKLPNISPTADSKGSGTLCASWQCLQGSRASPPNIGVQFLGSGASLSGLDIELVGSRYRMSLVKKRFATGKYMAGCSL